MSYEKHNFVSGQIPDCGDAESHGGGHCISTVVTNSTALLKKI